MNVRTKKQSQCNLVDEWITEVMNEIYPPLDRVTEIPLATGFEMNGESVRQKSSAAKLARNQSLILKRVQSQCIESR